MNFGTPVPLLIGIVLILGAVALFFLDKLKPGYGRDSDKVYAILWLISGVFLLGHLTMELLPSFQQLIMAGMLIALTIENVNSRTPKEDRYASQGASDMPMREPPYRPSRSQPYSGRSSARMNVRAELEDESAYRPRYASDRRMLGGRDEPPAGDPYYREDYPDRYGDERSYPPRSGEAAERPVGRLNPGSDRIRRRRPKAGDGRYGAEPSRGWDEPKTQYSSPNTGGYSSHSPTPPSTYPSNGSPDSDSYVDYRPVNSPRDESDQYPSDYGSRY